MVLGPCLQAQWQTATELPNVDFNGLTVRQKTQALAVLRQESCTCGCQMKVAQCRIEDPPCGDSRTLSAIVIKGVREGKTSAEIHTLLVDSDLAHIRASRNKILGDPMKIPIEGAPSKGPANARITLVEFSDFECPYCAEAVKKIEAVLQAYPNDVRLVYKQFPLSTHPHAQLAAEASLAALAQDRFWPMYDRLFANFRALSQEHILQIAKELGVDTPRMAADLASHKFRGAVLKDIADGEHVGVDATPSVFINGRQYNGQLDLQSIKPILDAELKKK